MSLAVHLPNMNQSAFKVAQTQAHTNMLAYTQTHTQTKIKKGEGWGELIYECIFNIIKNYYVQGLNNACKSLQWKYGGTHSISKEMSVRMHCICVCVCVCVHVCVKT